MTTKTIIVALATTMLAAGVTFAVAQERPATQMPAGHGAVLKDFSKLSADGTRGYQDLSLTRLAIYDGRIGDAKKLIADSVTAFGKAKTDDSVFMAAEADMKKATPAKPMAQNAPATNASASTTAPNGQANSNRDMTKPVAWLPVDGSVSINEDYSLQPAKAKAVAEANQSLAKGDRGGAMDKLKLAGVDVSVVMAVVPLQQTVSDVQQAAQLIDGGKYYEGSQKLRAVQDATIITVADMPAPAGADGQSAKSSTPPSTAPATPTPTTH